MRQPIIIAPIDYYRHVCVDDMRRKRLLVVLHVTANAPLFIAGFKCIHLPRFLLV